MELKIYRAPTLAEAVAKVKADLGHHALILHTRQIVQRYCLGLRRREVHEITAARNLPKRATVNKAVAMAKAAAAHAQARGPVGVGAKTGGTTLPFNPHATPTKITVPASTSGPLIDTAEASNVIFLDLSRQMDTIRTMVKDLSVQGKGREAPHVPEDLLEYYAELTANNVDAEAASEVLKGLQRAVRPEHMSNASFVRDKLAEQLERLLPVSGPIARTKARGPHVVALVGPTGVGKTTTIAKLAANLKLREKHSVGLITIDTYRIAAVDQLRRYADIIGAPLRVVGSTEEIGGAVESMGELEFVLIDTAGRSPNDTLKIGELRNFVSVAHADEVHLVLSATSAQECIEFAVERFGEVGIDKVIFTKLDEAKHVGVVLNVVRRVNKPLSYVTTGQDVPDDIEVARGRRLAQLILGSDL